MRHAGWALAAQILLAAPTAAERVALLPAEFAGEDAAAPTVVERLLAEGLEARGWEVVRGEPVERVLFEHRLRRVDSLPAAARQALLAELEVPALLLPAIETWLPGSNAIVALSARWLGAGGEPAGSVFFALTAAETGDPFGRGRAEVIDEVATTAVARLIERIEPLATAGRAPARTASRPFHLRRARAFRSAALDGDALRVALVPFTNLTRATAAARTAGMRLAAALAAGGEIEVIEAAELRAALLAEGVPSLRHLDAERLRAVGARLGSPLFARGTVWRWVEGSPYAGGVTPEVELEVELVDVERGRVVAAGHLGRRGDDYAGLLLRGTVWSAAELADRVAAELVAALLASAPVAEPSARSAPDPAAEPPLSGETPP